MIDAYANLAQSMSKSPERFQLIPSRPFSDMLADAEFRQKLNVEKITSQYSASSGAKFAILPMWFRGHWQLVVSLVDLLLRQTIILFNLQQIYDVKEKNLTFLTQCRLFQILTSS